MKSPLPHSPRLMHWPRPARPARPTQPPRLRLVLRCCALALIAGTAFAQDRADIDRTQIIGNRELPKVLYIVPWKKPLPGDLTGRPAASVLDEALAPIDRDVFRRRLQYDAQVAPRAAAVPGAAPAR